jgi:hypothetical protein
LQSFTSGRISNERIAGWLVIVTRVNLTRARAGALEVLGLLLLFVVFTRLHAVAGTDTAAATANALALQSAERAVHIDIERSANAWLAGHVVLSHLAVYVYRGYYAVVLGVLVWAFIRHADVYPQVRRTLVAMLVLVLPVYWAVPMSPPRFALPGAVDIVAAYDIVGHAARVAWTTPNHLTAMPSMHVGWSLWCAYAIWAALRVDRPRLALLAWLFPLLMAAVVITTGNHYVLDIAGSVALVATAIVVATVVGRRGPANRPAHGDTGQWQVPEPLSE